MTDFSETAAELAFECGDEFRYDLTLRKDIQRMLGGNSRVIIAQTCKEVAHVLEARAEERDAFWEEINWFENVPVIARYILSALSSDTCAVTHVIEWVEQEIEA